MSDSQALFAALRHSADAKTAAAIEQLVTSGADRELVRINVLAFAAARGLDEEHTIAAFLHASQLGIFDLSWDVLCPTCRGVLDVTTTLKDVHREPYECALCSKSFEVSLDEMIEVVFTVSPRVRKSPPTIRIHCRSGTITGRCIGVPPSTYPTRDSSA